MTRINVLTAGFTSQTARAFLTPLVMYGEGLRARGLDCEIQTSIAPRLRTCDVIIVESKFYRSAWSTEGARVVEQLAWMKEKGARLVFADTGDSTGNLVVPALRVADHYWKAQLCRDRSMYTRPMYGARAYTDYYFREHSVHDVTPLWSTPVDVELLSKLRASWNLGFAHHGRWGPYMSEIFARAGTRLALRRPRRDTPPGGERDGLFFRFNTRYSRETVGYQRQQVLTRLGADQDHQRVGRGRYFAELRQSRLALSPFGWGEINVRDFEAMLCGTPVLKPDMRHVETYPDLFRNEETVAAHRWDLSDLEEAVARALEPELGVPVARRAQDEYLDGLTQRSFLQRFETLVEGIS